MTKTASFIDAASRDGLLGWKSLDGETTIPFRAARLKTDAVRVAGAKPGAQAQDVE